MKRVIKNFMYNTKYAHLFCVKYKFQYYPPNLCLLANLLTEAVRVNGCVVEAGCFEGATTVWLCKTMQALGINKAYYALDTFKGFVEEHVDYEVKSRQKNKIKIMADFSNNSKKWFDKTMDVNNINNVKSIETDAAKFDYSSLGTIAFALIDVDLYIPVKHVLEKIYPIMSPGGIIAVDDCVDNKIYDGALQAYHEFVETNNLPFIVENGKIGIVRL